MTLLIPRRSLLKRPAIVAASGWSALPTLTNGGAYIAYWNFQPGNFTEVSGHITSVTDLTGNGNTLTNNGTVPYNAASAYNSQPAADFLGSSGVLYNSNFNLVGVSGAVSLNVMILTRPNASIGIFSVLCGYGGNASTAWATGADIYLAVNNPATTFTYTGVTNSGNTLGANYRMVAAAKGPIDTNDMEGWLNGVNVAANSFYNESYTTGGMFGIGGNWAGSTPAWGNNWYGPVVAGLVWSGPINTTDASNLNTWAVGNAGA